MEQVYRKNGTSYDTKGVWSDDLGLPVSDVFSS